MSTTIVTPTIIQGPAYVGTGGVILYVQDDITVEEIVESWTPKSTFGDLGKRHKSRAFRIDFTPVGMLTSGLLNWMYAAHLAPQTYVGASIFPSSNKAVTIYSVVENKSYGYVQGGIWALPDLQLSPTKTAFGKMSLICIGGAGVSPTNANFIKAATGTVSGDTSFDATKIESNIYSAALGSLTTPYNAIGSMDGFTFKFGYKPKVIYAGDVGIGDVILDADGFDLTVQFAPSNLTEAQVDTLLGYQNSAAVLPGQAYGNNTEGGNLVVTDQINGWVFTATKMGARSAKRIYKIGEHRYPNGALEFVNTLTITTGAPNPLFAFTAGT